MERILYVHSSAELYGSDRSLLGLVAGVRERFEPVVALPASGPLVDELEKVGADVRVLPLVVLRHGERPREMATRWVVGMRAMLGLIDEVRPAIVHSNTLGVTEGACAARLKGAPHIHHVRELIARPAAFRFVLARMAELTSQRVIANSTAVATWFAGRSLLLRDRTVVVHNGCAFGDTTPREAREATGESPLVFAVIARLNAWKGQDLTLAAVARLSPDVRARTRVVFAGDAFRGKEHFLTDLRALAVRLGVADRVEFVGYVPSAEVLAASDAVLVPSLAPEPFGNVLLEAMDVGLPIVATAQGGPLDVVVDGKTGLLTAPQPGALAAAMTRFVLDRELRALCGGAGWRRARERFTLERTVQKVMTVYGDVLARQGRRAG